MINFRTKISYERPLRNNTDIAGLTPQELPYWQQRQFESDRGRILNSAAVRRLQQKTQVFPLERNSAVRSRLTHSLEVQQVGRFIVQTIIRKLTNDYQEMAVLEKYGLDGLEHQLETLVEMACLMHDIGNPPFGHFGEQAIIDWFKKNLKKTTPTGVELSDELKLDIKGFEGNAQGIRLVHTLLGLNLTYTQVAGILKYTRCGTEPKPEKEQPFAYLKKKVGYYLSEKTFIQQLQHRLDLAPGHRHPIAYIMEAADDISYGIADLEDAVEKGILDTTRLSTELKAAYDKQLKGLEPSSQNYMEDALKYAQNEQKKAEHCGDSQYFIALRYKLAHPMVQHAAQRFIDNVESVYAGDFDEPLLQENTHEGALTEALKSVAFKFVFRNKEVEAGELQGYKVIHGLFDCYAPLLRLKRDTFAKVLKGDNRKRLFESRLAKKLPNKHLRAYASIVDDNLSDELEFYYRCRLLQDFISGMTDQYAYDEYRALMVIE